MPRPTFSKSRAGFTAIELLVVIGIMLILMGIAVPPVVGALRRGKVNEAANGVMQCWRQARSLAMANPMPETPADGSQPKHYGVAVVADPAQGSYAAVIYGSTVIDTPAEAADAVLRVDPNGPADDKTNPAVAKFRFNRAVAVRSAAPDATSVDSTDRTLAVYAQYRTGLPISAGDVAGGSGPTASPISVGMGPNPTFHVPGSPVTSLLQLQTLDFGANNVKRGYGLKLTLFPVGVLATQEL
jgi:prepilin-type N-terminal cleavage/methylation domain-containing protein